MQAKKYEVRYMCDTIGTLLDSNLDYEEAQKCVRKYSNSMHPDNIAPLVIRQIREKFNAL